MTKAIYWYEHWSKNKSKNDFEKDFVNLMNHAVFGKSMEKVRKHRDIKLIATERRKNYLLLEPNYHRA